MRVERNINTALVGCFSTCLCSTPRATAKEDFASLWDFYTFILSLYSRYPSPGAFLSVSIIQNFYTKLHLRTDHAVSQYASLDILKIEQKWLHVNEMGNSAKQFNIALLQQQLRTLSFAIGNRLVYVPTVGSTNILAMQLARAGSEEGLLVLTDSQTAGKGRQGRRWVDVYGCNVLSSLVLRPLFSMYLLVMIASLAVVEAIQEIGGEYGTTATIKWPNDVLIGNRKVAGILVETSHDRSGQLIAIVGIGVNVNGHLTSEQVTAPEMATLVATATTLETVYGRPISREFFLAALLRYIEAYYLALQQEARNSPMPNHIVGTGSTSRSVREKWRSYLSTLDRTIHVRQGDTVLEGIAEDVSETGELLLRLHSGERISISWGDIGYPTE